MWRQSRLLNLKLWHNTVQGARQSCELLLEVGGVRHRHSAGKQRVIQLERDVARLQATSLEQLQEQVRQKAKSDAAAVSVPELDFNNLALQAVREHNSSMPLVAGQLLKGSVIRVDRKTVWLDVGLAKHAKFFRSQVQLSSVIETTSDAARTGPNDIRVGDVLHVTLETTETPFGDPAVSLEMPKGPDRLERTMDELKLAFENKQQVMGRILNPLNGGYAIGVGGIVGFCPFKLCTLPTAARIGILQPFYIEQFTRAPFNMVLEDAHASQKQHLASRLSTSEEQPIQTADASEQMPAASPPKPPTDSPAAAQSPLAAPALSADLSQTGNHKHVGETDLRAAEQEAMKLMGNWQPSESDEEDAVSRLDQEAAARRGESH